MIIDPFFRFKTVLRHEGRSLTKVRQIIFAALQDQEPQTMAEVVVACQGQVDRASVYRTIALFEQLGIVHRLSIGWKHKLELTDSFHHHHHHLTCNRCGQTRTLPEDIQLERLLRTLAQTQAFTMQNHQLEIQGVCEKCMVQARAFQP